MKKAKVIILSSALSLITIGVLAGRAKFAVQGLVADDGGTMRQISTFSSFPGTIDLQTTANGTQVSITDDAGNPHLVYYYNGSTTQPVYTKGW